MFVDTLSNVESQDAIIKYLLMKLDSSCLFLVYVSPLVPVREKRGFSLAGIYGRIILKTDMVR